MADIHPVPWIRRRKSVLRRRRVEHMFYRRLRAVTVEAPVVHPELWAAVRALPERQRIAVVLRYVADLTEPQIADAMHIRRGTVASTLFAARLHLAEMLDDPDVLEVEHG